MGREDLHRNDTRLDCISSGILDSNCSGFIEIGILLMTGEFSFFLMTELQ